jgi:hypothetical protein
LRATCILIHPHAAARLEYVVVLSGHDRPLKSTERLADTAVKLP